MPNLRNKTWKNGENGGTPITADDMNFIEDHLFDGQGGENAGHIIVSSDNSELEARNKLQFIGTGVTSVSNDEDKTVVIISGEKGDAAIIELGTVETVSSSEAASIVNAGNSSHAILNFKLPKGEKGDKGTKGNPGDPGQQGVQGVPGKDGISPTITIGTVETVENSTSASVTNSGSNSNVILNFQIPKGKDGLGSGDMSKAIYDTDNDGVIDKAKLAETANNAQKVNDFTVARNVFADEYTNQQINEMLTSVSIDLSDYYNKNQVNKLLQEKQNNLIAGTGINLNDNTISSNTVTEIFNYTLDVSNWIDVSEQTHIAKYTQVISKDITTAKMVSIGFVDSAEFKKQCEAGIIINTVDSSNIEFVVLNKKPTENIQVKVVVLW